MSELKTGENNSIGKVSKTDMQNEFYQWLVEVAKLAPASARSYVSAINTAENFAIHHVREAFALYDVNQYQAKEAINELEHNKDFVGLTEEKYNHFSAAFKKLLEFLGSSSHAGIDATDDSITKANIMLFQNVLIHKFPKGFRIHSFIDKRKFKRYYEELNGVPCDFSDEQIIQNVLRCGIEYNGSIYIPEQILSDELKNKLFTYIEQQFNEGKSSIYFKALLAKFTDEFLEYQMYDENMLRDYIAYFASNRYFFAKDHLSKEKDTAIEPIDELRTLLRENVYPLKITEICQKLPNIPEDNIRSLLGGNLEFVRNSKGEYFHADSLDLTDAELNDISNLITDEIKISGYISGNELYDAIRQKYPATFDKNKVFSSIGWRDAIKYKLNDKFSFDGGIISAKDKAFSTKDVFARFAQNKQKFTLLELEQFAQNAGTGSVIYFEPIYKYAARINKNEFVRKDSIDFQVEATDKILERFCAGDYISLKQVDNFAILPDASYPWNEYLLESYLASRSEQFMLIHGGYNKNHVVGAMAKKSSNIRDFDELLTRIIADSDIPLQKEAALNYLADVGYIARRSYNKIEQILINARAMRNRKES